MTRDLRRRLKRKGLDARQIKVYAHLHSHCFNGPECWPSQKLIGQRCGLSRQLVNQVCQELRDHHVLTWTHEHRRGSEHKVNVYRLRYWSRPKIMGTVRVLKRLSSCSQVLPDTKGQSRRALAPERDERNRDQGCGKGHSFLGADVLGTTSAGQATSAVDASARAQEIQVRRSSRMDQSRRSHIQAVPDLTSQPLLEELERKDDIIRKLQLELNKSMENEAGALAAAKAAGNALNAAKGQLTKDQKKSAKAGQVQQVVDHWRLLRPRTGPEFGEPGSKSFAVIEKALVLMANDPVGPVAACCEAIDGLHMAPWWSYGKRYATPGEGRVLKRDLEHALGDEQRIVKCRGVVRWMRAGGVERAWEKYLAVQETESVLRAEVLDLLGEQRFRREEPAEWCFVDGVRTSLDEKAEKGTRSE